MELVKRVLNQYNLVIVELREQARNAARLFNSTIKNHALEHVALDSSELSPGWVWTFTSEGFLGRARKLAQATSPGSSPALARKKVTANYVQALVGELAASAFLVVVMKKVAAWQLLQT